MPRRNRSQPASIFIPSPGLREAGRRGCLALAMAFFFLFPGGVLADNWSFPEAKVRLRLARETGLRHAFTMRVDIPSPASGLSIAGAKLADGTSLAFRAIRQNDRLIAVEINLPGGIAGGPNQAWKTDATGFPDPLPALLYLSAADRDAPAPSSPRRPFAVFGTTERSITRPLKAAHIAPYWQRLGHLPFLRDSGPGRALEIAVAQAIAEGRGDQPRRPAMLHRLQISTSLLLAEDLDLHFGATASPAAWFVFANGRPVAAWRESDGGPDREALAAAVKLPAGIHDTTFVIMARHGEKPPMPIVRIGDREKRMLPADAFVSSHIPAAIRVEYRERDIHPGVAWQAATLLLPNQRLAYHAVATADLTQGGEAEREGTRFALPDGPPEKAGIRMTHETPPRFLRVLPAAKGNDFSVPLPSFPRQKTVVAMPELFIESQPTIVEPGTDIEIRLLVQGLPLDFLPGIALQAMVRIESQDARGRAIEAVELPVKSPDASLTARFPVDENASRITFAGWLAGVPVTAPLTLRLLKPEDDWADLQVVGDRLFADGQPVVLRVDRHRPARTTFAQSPKRLPKDARVAWVDMFVAPGLAPGALGDPAAMIAADSQLQVARLDQTSIRQAGGLPELWMFELVARAFASQPDAIVLGVGGYDLKAGIDRDERFRRLLFLVQAALAREIVPILITPPPLAMIEHEEVRITALAIKRLALQMKLPVCDAYSAAHALRTQPEHPAFEAFGQADRHIETRGMNDAGRQWFAERLTKTLLEIVGEQ